MTLLRKPLLLFALILCIASATKTIFSFSRKINTCDAKDNPVEEGISKVVWAYNDVKPKDEMSIAKHQERGIKSVRFFTEDDATIPPDASGSIDLKIPNVHILFNDPDFGPTTNYWCQPFKLDLPNEVQLIRLDPITDPRSVRQLHHIALYRCRTPLSEEDLAYSGGCYMANTPVALQECNSKENLGGWGVGGTSFELPANVGFPLGQGLTYLMMEVHYDNPTQVQVIDSSGLKAWITNTPRPQAADVLITGYVTHQMFYIPPGQPAYTLSGWLTNDCSQQFFPSEGLTVFAVSLHAHTTARTLKLRHYRNGIELKPILEEPYYDFGYQENTKVNATLFPGDTLRVDCTYDTMARQLNTTFGLSTQQEMCVSSLYYYPALATGTLYAFTYDDPAGGGIGGICQEGHFAGWNAPTAVPYVPPPCNRVAPDNNTLTPVLVSNPLHGKSWDRAIFLDLEQKYKLYWKVDHTNLLIHGAVEVETTGWIGFGITKLGMEGADVFIGWIDENGVPQLLDRFAELKALPSVDQLQDFYDVTAAEIQPSSSKSSFPQWAALTLVLGVVALAAAIAIFLYMRSPKAIPYSELEGHSPRSQHESVPL